MLADSVDNVEMEDFQHELDYNVLILGIIICITVSFLLMYGSALGSYRELFESLHWISPESIASCPRG